MSQKNNKTKPKTLYSLRNGTVSKIELENFHEFKEQELKRLEEEKKPRGLHSIRKSDGIQWKIDHPQTKLWHYEKPKHEPENDGKNFILNGLIIIYKSNFDFQLKINEDFDNPKSKTKKEKTKPKVNDSRVKETNQEENESEDELKMLDDEEEVNEEESTLEKPPQEIEKKDSKQEPINEVKKASKQEEVFEANDPERGVSPSDPRRDLQRLPTLAELMSAKVS